MNRETRQRLETLMSRMADGDYAAAVALQLEFTGALRGVARTILRDLHREDVLRDRDEMDGLVRDISFVLFDHAASWRPDGALPWVWANRAIRAAVVRAIGHPIGGTDEDLESEASAGEADGVDLGLETFLHLARSNAHVAMVVELFYGTLSERDASIVLDYQLMKADGRPDASGTVASLYGTSSANVRQVRRRAMAKLAPALKSDRYAPIAHLPLLAA